MASLVEELRHEAKYTPLLIKKDLFLRAAGRIDQLEIENRRLRDELSNWHAQSYGANDDGR